MGAVCSASLVLKYTTRHKHMRTYSIHVDANSNTRLKLHATLIAQQHTPHACYDWITYPTIDDAVAFEAHGSHPCVNKWASLP